jgi:hypothetical protein
MQNVGSTIPAMPRSAQRQVETGETPCSLASAGREIRSRADATGRETIFDLDHGRLLMPMIEAYANG